MEEEELGEDLGVDSRRIRGKHGASNGSADRTIERGSSTSGNGSSTRPTGGATRLGFPSLSKIFSRYCAPLFLSSVPR